MRHLVLSAVSALVLMLATGAAEARPYDAKALARYDSSYVQCEARNPEMKGHRDEAYLELWRIPPDQKSLGPARQAACRSGLCRREEDRGEGADERIGAGIWRRRPAMPRPLGRAPARGLGEAPLSVDMAAQRARESRVAIRPAPPCAHDRCRAAVHVAVVDDEVDITRLLGNYLQTHGYRVTQLHSGRALLQLMESDVPALVLLDVGLPGEDGFSIARQLREHWDCGLVIVTGRGDAVDKVVGLEVGADDYVTKPFDLRELLARVKAVLRRSSAATAVAAAANRRAGASRRQAPLRRLGARPRGAQPRSIRRRATSRSRAASSRCSRCWSSTRARCCRATSCSSRRAAARPRRSTARSTSRSAACARRSRSTPRIRSSSSRCAARATSSCRR